MDRVKLILGFLTVSDWINIANIVVTASIGLLIAHVIQNNLTKERFEKEHFIGEVKDIRDQYKQFINKLYCGRKSSKDIKEWFKIMSNKVKTLEESLKLRFNINELTLCSKHAEIQQKVTIMDEFNESYQKPCVIFNESSKNEILKLHNDFSNVITDRIVELNSAKKKRRFLWRK